MSNNYDLTVTVVKDIPQKCLIENRRRIRKRMLDKVHEQYKSTMKAIDEIVIMLNC